MPIGQVEDLPRIGEAEPLLGPRAARSLLTRTVRPQQSRFPHHEIWLVGKIVFEARIQLPDSVKLNHIEIIFQRVERICVSGGNCRPILRSFASHGRESESFGLVHMAVINVRCNDRHFETRLER